MYGQNFQTYVDLPHSFNKLAVEASTLLDLNTGVRRALQAARGRMGACAAGVGQGQALEERVTCVVEGMMLNPGVLGELHSRGNSLGKVRGTDGACRKPWIPSWWLEGHAWAGWRTAVRIVSPHPSRNETGSLLPTSRGHE